MTLFTAIIESVPDGTWEFVCHPGYSDADLDSVRTRLRQSREQELALLTSPEATELLHRRGIQRSAITSYSLLADTMNVPPSHAAPGT